jgi:hypothetical protein
MIGIHAHTAVSDAFQAAHAIEATIVATLSPDTRTTIRHARARSLHYLATAQRLEAETMRAACALADYAENPTAPDLVRSLARSRATQLLTLAAHHGEAWLLYEAIQDRPLGEIVCALCDAGFADHARYLISGEWLIDDEPDTAELAA